MNARNFATAVVVTAGLMGCSGAEVEDSSHTPEYVSTQCPDGTHFAMGELYPQDSKSVGGCLNDRWKSVNDLRGICSTKVLQVTKNKSWRCGDYPRR